MVERQAGAEHALLVRVGPEPLAQRAGERDVDVLLEHDQAVEWDERDVGGQRVEVVPDERVPEEIEQQGFVALAERADRRIVREAGLLPRELLDHEARVLPLVHERTLAGGVE